VTDTLTGFTKGSIGDVALSDAAKQVMEHLAMVLQHLQDTTVDGGVPNVHVVPPQINVPVHENVTLNNGVVMVSVIKILFSLF
jgi:hypothetical protein